MPYEGHGQPPFPDHRRVAQAGSRKHRHPVPAMTTVLENADQVLDREVLTVNRAGSDRRNPILAGLGVQLTIPVGSKDDVVGLWLFQRHARRGNNLRAHVTQTAPGVYGFEFLAGAGLTVAGTPAEGAAANLVRVETVRGSFEKIFYVQEHDHDAVVVNGEASLDPDTMEPVEIVLEIVDASRPWLDVPVDFFLSWNDAFLRLHRAGDTDAESGFAKPYGGAAFVSIFDKAPGTEGVGVQVNPVTQGRIESRRKIQVQNTVGVKELVARFRARQDSPYFIDVPVRLRLVDQDEVCRAPATAPCSDVYVKAGSAVPEGFPAVVSQPEVQVVAGPAPIATQDLLLITVRAASVGGTPKVRIRRWQYVPSIQKLAGVAMVQVGDDEDYLPLVMGASTPVVEEPYGPPKRLTVALSVAQLKADQVAWIEAVVVDGLKPGMPVLIPGPRARDIQYSPISTSGLGAGGGPVCGY